MTRLGVVKYFWGCCLNLVLTVLVVYECPFDLRSAMMMIGKFGPKMPPEHLPKNVAISSVVHRL